MWARWSSQRQVSGSLFCPVLNCLIMWPPFTISTLFLQNTTDAIGRAAAEAMQGPIQTAYKDTFQSIVLPVFERGCQSMFQQINDSFRQGTQECKTLLSNKSLCWTESKQLLKRTILSGIWSVSINVYTFFTLTKIYSTVLGHQYLFVVLAGFNNPSIFIFQPLYEDTNRKCRTHVHKIKNIYIHIWLMWPPLALSTI